MCPGDDSRSDKQTHVLYEGVALKHRLILHAIHVKRPHRLVVNPPCRGVARLPLAVCGPVIEDHAHIHFPPVNSADSRPCPSIYGKPLFCGSANGNCWL